MATELGKAYVQIMPSARGISGNITKELNGQMATAGNSAGNILGGSLFGTLAKVAATIGVGKLFADAIGEAGNLQQSFGGLETIYGEAAEAAKNYAAQAAAAGISSNNFAEQAVSFGAALRQAYEGDTVAAIDAANMAILDMADNAAKMGTPLESIQNAYAGFAKQNYTMLDNLKLGYGGTKEEMERLLARAQEISGVEYDISNLGDVYAAIHVIQDELGVAGVAAEEAKTTLTGSFGAMKAAATNLMGSLALGDDITNELSVLTEAFFTWAKNLLPLVGNVLKGLPQMVSTILSSAIGGLNMLKNNARGIVQVGADLLSQLTTGIIGALPYLAEAAIAIVAEIGRQFLAVDWLETATNLINSIGSAMSLAAGEILGADTSIIETIGTAITNGLPELLNKGVEIITTLGNGILENIPGLITTAGELISSFVGFILQNLPALLSAGVSLIGNLAQGFLQNLPALVTAAAGAIFGLLAEIGAHLPELLAKGGELLGEVASGIVRAIPDLVGKIPQVIQGIVNKFAEFDWLSIGKNIIDGIAAGVTQFGSTLITSILGIAGNAFDAVKNFFGISSPSKLMEKEIGRWIPAGIAQGIIKNMNPVISAMSDIGNVATASIDTDLDGGNVSANRNGTTEAILALLMRYLPEIAAKTDFDFQSLVDAINRELGMAYA